ncbi:rhizopuspepsin 3 precursor [Phycomyces nitens]|nr:rhizopuspepsin 3 precursor [Phycomyces nitens]
MNYLFTLILLVSLYASLIFSEKTHICPLFVNHDRHHDASRSVWMACYKYHKYCKIPTPGSPNTGTIALNTPGIDSIYYGTIQVGTPGQEIRLNFDTGSSDFWFASSLCLNCNVGTQRFDPSMSSTYKPSNLTWKISYGDTSMASGIVGYDTVNISGLIIHKQAIELASNAFVVIGEYPADGFFGIGFDSDATIEGFQTPMDNMISQGLISRGLFGVFLGKQSNGGGGEIVFGGYNPLHINGSLTYAPVNSSRGLWEIKVSGITAGSDCLLHNSSSLSGVLDTGTTLILFPEDIASAVAKAYNATEKDDGSGTYIIDCNVSDFSPLTFIISGNEFSIPPTDLVFDNVGSVCTAGFGYFNSQFAILGDVFLKNNYVVFDIEKPGVLIAPSK